jgi:hypothetical protein
MKFNILDKVARAGDEYIYTVIGYNSFGEVVLAQAGNNIGVPTVSESELTHIYSEKPRSKYDFLKMYVLVKDTAPIGLGINACSHAGYLASKWLQSSITTEWEKHSFKKVTCLVSPEQFDEAIREIENIGGNFVVFNENDWNDEVLSVAFEPRYSFPDIFKTFKLHSGVVGN